MPSIRIGNTLGIGQNGSLLNPFPVPSLQTLASDLTVKKVGSDYYFKSLVGSDILITNYDFPEGWVKGWPLKSKATIDVFGQIAVPVISLFQNLDYGNQYFTKQVAQVVDENGIEISPAYVSAIVAYSEVLTGDNLAIAQIFYNAPSELTTGVYWVSTSGVYPAGTGSKINPWLAVALANTSAVAGSTVYIKSGSFVEDPGTGYLSTTKTLTYKAIGFSIVKSNSAIHVVQANSNNPTFNNVIFDGQNNANYCINVYGANVKTLTYNRCLFANFKLAAYNGGSAIETSIFSQCVIIGKLIAERAAQDFKTATNLIDSCYFTNIVLMPYLLDFTIKNSKIINTERVSISAQSVGINSLGNTYYNNGAVFTSPDYVAVKAASFYKDRFIDQRLINSAGQVAINLVGTINAGIKNSAFESLITAFSSGSIFVKAFVGTDRTNEIENNSFLSKATTNFQHILAQGIGAKIKTNYSKSNSLSDMQVALGGEWSNANLNDGSIVEGNRIVGFKHDLPASTGTTHCLFVGNGVNIKTRYNYISESCIGLVVKTGAQQSYTSEGVYGNIIVDCTKSIWVRGVSALNVFNNTIIHTATAYGQEFDSCIILDENSAIAGDQFCENVIVKNSIIISLRNAGLLQNWDAHAGANGCTADYNIYYSSVAKPFKIGATTYSFAEWQALGYDTHSVMLSSLAAAKSLFTDFDNGDYSLASGSAAIGAGATLAGYTTLLDSASTWASETTTALIVTKENTSLCVGAYIR